MSFTVALLASNWTSLLPSSNIPETLPLMSDFLSATCVRIDFRGGDVHLRGQLTGNVNNSLHVTLTMATSIAFGPGPGQANCHPMTSSLLIHQRTACNQTVCAIPTACRYICNKVISTVPALWEYDFICVCDQAMYNELMLWLRPDAIQDQPNGIDLCEISVWSIWFI